MTMAPRNIKLDTIKRDEEGFPEAISDDFFAYILRATQPQSKMCKEPRNQPGR